MAAPYLIVGCAGDSNAAIGKFGLNEGTDLAGSRIFTFRSTWTGAGAFTGTPTINAADEPLDHKGMGSGTLASGTGLVGSTVALCRLLRDRGKLPDGFDILIVPAAHAGTAFADYWATTPAYVDGVTGGRRALTPFIDALTYAMALHASNRMWFFDWNHGANDSSQTQQQYTDNMVATFAEIRSTIATASRTPLLVSGIPPNHVDPLLGGDTTHHTGVIAAQQAIAANVPDSIYVDVTGLTSIDNTNDYVHFAAVDHRGGTNNAPGNTSEVQTNPLSERKYNALLQIGWPARMTWA